MTDNCDNILGYPKNRTHLDILRQYSVNKNWKRLLVEGQLGMHFRVSKNQNEVSAVISSYCYAKLR